jgi:acetyltransferase
MYPSLQAIFAPPAARRRLAAQEEDTIPVITACRRTLRVRAVTIGDTELLAELFTGLSDHSSRLRFFRPLARELAWAEAARVTRAGAASTALVAIAEEQGATRAVALAELAHDPAAPDVAEFAIVVRDDYQREGLGKILTRLLLELARLRGVATLRATLLADNQALRRLMRGLDLPYKAETRYGETTMLTELGYA